MSTTDVEFATKTLLSLVPDAKNITATTLSGGVSCDTIKVNWHNGSGVIKRALAQLRVPGTWEADIDRILAEGDAITMYHQLTPEFVPKLLGRNDDELAIMLELAPEDMSEWRLQMLEGIVNPTIGSELGKVLGIWQFTSAWNDFLFAIFLTGGSPKLAVATTALNWLTGSSNQVYYGKNMTASLMASIPTLLVYMFLGRYFLRGLLSGSLKG